MSITCKSCEGMWDTNGVTEVAPFCPKFCFHLTSHGHSDNTWHAEFHFKSFSDVKHFSTAVSFSTIDAGLFFCVSVAVMSHDLHAPCSPVSGWTASFVSFCTWFPQDQVSQGMFPSPWHLPIHDFAECSCVHRGVRPQKTQSHTVHGLSLQNMLSHWPFSETQRPERERLKLVKKTKAAFQVQSMNGQLLVRF